MPTTVPTEIIRPPPKLVGRKVCLFVSYSSVGAIKPHVAFHLKEIKKCGFATVLMLVTDEPKLASSGLLPTDHALILRRNAGFDFGGWADAFRLFPDLWHSQCVLLVNDSIFGPMTDLRPTMASALDAPADLVGLTQSIQKKFHLQSFFLLMKQAALSNPEVQLFWDQVRNLTTKQEVIDTYEINLTSFFEKNGLKTKAIFPLKDFGIVSANPSINLWIVLLNRGFPYIKIELFRELIGPDAWLQHKILFHNRRIVKLIDDYIEKNVPLHRKHCPPRTDDRAI